MITLIWFAMENRVDTDMRNKQLIFVLLAAIDVAIIALLLAIGE